MNLSAYEMFSLFYIPYSLIIWILDFLSDKEVNHDEFEIGVFQYLHHLFGVITIGMSFLPILTNSLSITVLSIIVLFVTEVGFLINNDSCWFLTLTNNKINPGKPNRKWRAEIVSLLKHYIRGDEWAYSDITHNINYSTVKLINTAMIIHLIKLIIIPVATTILVANTMRVANK